MDYNITSFLNSLSGRSNFLDNIIVFFGSHLAYIIIVLLILFLIKPSLFFGKKIDKDKLKMGLIIVEAFIAAFVSRFIVV